MRVLRMSLQLRLLALVGALAIVAAGVGIAMAAIPDASGVITACYMKSGGTLRVIDPSVTKCRTSETMLQWSQNGEQPGQVPGALTQTDVYQTSDTDEPLHMTNKGEWYTVSTIHKPAGGWWDNAAITASINIGNGNQAATAGRVVVKCMLPGGGMVFPLDKGSFGTENVSVSYSGGDPDIVLKCQLDSVYQPSDPPYDVTVGWATVSVVPASSVNFVNH